MAKGLNQEDAGVSPTHDFGAAAKITRRAADRLRAGHLWVYRSDVEKLLPASGATSEAREIPAGALVTVLDGRGAPLGTALFSSASQICLRLVSEEPGLTRAAYLDALRARVGAALRLRDALVPEATLKSAENNGCRLLFSEADGLPGIVADRYNGLVV